MRCLVCKKLMRPKVCWNNLFQEKNLYTCDECFKKYPINITYEVIPFKKSIHVFSLFDTFYKINPNAFMFEMTTLVSFVSRKFNLNRSAVFIFEDFDDFVKYERNFDYLENFENEVVAILTFSYKI